MKSGYEIVKLKLKTCMCTRGRQVHRAGLNYLVTREVSQGNCTLKLMFGSLTGWEYPSCKLQIPSTVENSAFQESLLWATQKPQLHFQLPASLAEQTEHFRGGSQLLSKEHRKVMGRDSFVSQQSCCVPAGCAGWSRLCGVGTVLDPSGFWIRSWDSNPSSAILTLEFQSHVSLQISLTVPSLTTG